MRKAQQVTRLILVSILAAMAVSGLCHAAVADAVEPVRALVTAPHGPMPAMKVIAPALDPANGEVVGVAQPVIIRFNAPIGDHVAAERAITITSSKMTTGHFSWTNDSQVRWSPDRFWPANTNVTVQAAGSKSQFQVGDALVAVANTSTHQFIVSINGQVVQTMPASMGKPGHETPLGTFPVLEKFRTMVMDSSTYGVPVDSPEGYRINVEYATRITWGGIFVHAAPWSVDSQGHANVSHGCINLSTGNAQWFFDNAKKGDPVIVQA